MAYTEKTIFPFPFTLNGIWSWWQFSFRFWTKWKSIWFKIERITVITIISHPIWKEREIQASALFNTKVFIHWSTLCSDPFDFWYVDILCIQLWCNGPRGFRVSSIGHTWLSTDASLSVSCTPVSCWFPSLVQ